MSRSAVPPTLTRAPEPSKLKAFPILPLPYVTVPIDEVAVIALPRSARLPSPGSQTTKPAGGAAQTLTATNTRRQTRTIAIGTRSIAPASSPVIHNRVCDIVENRLDMLESFPILESH